MKAYLLPPASGNRAAWLREVSAAFEESNQPMAEHYRDVLHVLEHPGNYHKPFMYKKGHGPYVSIRTCVGTVWIKVDKR